MRNGVYEIYFLLTKKYLYEFKKYILDYPGALLPGVEDVVLPDGDAVVGEADPLETLPHEVGADDAEGAAPPRGLGQVAAQVDAEVLEAGAGAAVAGVGHAVPGLGSRGLAVEVGQPVVPAQSAVLAQRADDVRTLCLRPVSCTSSAHLTPHTPSGLVSAGGLAGSE